MSKNWPISCFGFSENQRNQIEYSCLQKKKKQQCGFLKRIFRLRSIISHLFEIFSRLSWTYVNILIWGVFKFFKISKNQTHQMLYCGWFMRQKFFWTHSCERAYQKLQTHQFLAKTKICNHSNKTWQKEVFLEINCIIYDTNVRPGSTFPKLK